MVRGGRPFPIAILVAMLVTACAGPTAPTEPATPASPASPAATPAGSPSVIPSVSPVVTPSEAAVRSPSPSPSPAGPLTLRSAAFEPNGSIPRKNTCDGADTSPPLAWSNIPAGTVSLALIVTDPDAGGFTHWVAFAIDPVAGSLPEGASGTSGFHEGRNSFGKVGWNGPCPPSGTHRYVFELFALDEKPTVEGSPTADKLRSAMRGHTIGTAKLTGVYRRS